MFKDLECNGTEASLFQCAHSSLYDLGGCGQGQVGVICKGILPKTKVIVKNVGSCKSVSGFKISKNN